MGTGTFFPLASGSKKPGSKKEPGFALYGAPNGTRVRLRRPRLRAAPQPSHARWEMLAHFLSLATLMGSSPGMR